MYRCVSVYLIVGDILFTFALFVLILFKQQISIIYYVYSINNPDTQMCLIYKNGYSLQLLQDGETIIYLNKIKIFL